MVAVHGRMDKSVMQRRLNEPNKRAIIQEITPERWRKLVRRLNALEPGRRYMLLVTVGETPDWTVQEVGRVER